MAVFKKGHRPYGSRIRKRGRYVIAYTCKRKNAKRHIYGRYNDARYCIKMVKDVAAMHPNWIVKVYDYNWEELSNSDLIKEDKENGKI